MDDARHLPAATIAITSLAVVAMVLAGPPSPPVPPVTMEADATPVAGDLAGDLAGDPGGDVGRATDPLPARPTSADVVPEPPVTSRSDEGFAVLEGASEAGSGPTVTFTVEVEPASGIDPAEALEVVEGALFDPRSWSRDVHLVRADEPTEATIRVLFATPRTVDRLCEQAGLETHGYYSCWNGTFAAINSWRYAFGSTGFDDLEVYRRYVVNHEVGHGLGHGHATCPGHDQLAPIMQPQTATLGACRANGWPHPDG